MGKLTWVQQRTIQSTLKPFEVAMKHKDIGGQAEIFIKTINRFPNYTVNNVRHSMLSDNGLPADIRKLRKKKNLTDNDIIEYYWGFDKFVELWTKYLEMDKDNFVFCVEVMSRDKDWVSKDYENKLNL